MANPSFIITATGKRKTSVARVRLKPGTGMIRVNGRNMDEYFPREALQIVIRGPFDKTETLGRYDIEANIDGGGTSGQAGALRHGIARALCAFDLEMRKKLKKAGLLTRDARCKERKKYGQKGARRRFQFSKR